MLNWFKGNRYSKYRDILIRSFPITLKKDVESVLNVLSFDVNVVRSFDGQNYTVEELVHPHGQTVNLDGELLTIPYRVYFNEPEIEREETLTNRQKTILNCIFLRHHNGYIRQRCLEKMESNEYWVTPFTFQLLGEYIYKIIEVLYDRLDDKQLEIYKRFANENPKYFQQTESRMISYWNKYYRSKFSELKLYAGKIIFDLIKTKKVGNDK